MGAEYLWGKSERERERYLGERIINRDLEISRMITHEKRKCLDWNACGSTKKQSKNGLE